MSLDVYLTVENPVKSNGSGIFVRENGSTVEISREEWEEKFPGREPIVVQGAEESFEVYTANITHNLGKMAREAGLYEYLWRPDEINISLAIQLISPLFNGLQELKSDPEKYKKFNPPNGWGDYKGLVEFVEKYLEACKK